VPSPGGLGKTIVFVTHDLREHYFLPQRIILLESRPHCRQRFAGGISSP